MSAASDYQENLWLNLMFTAAADTPEAILYIGLFTADPGESGVTSEFTIGAGAYARAVVTNNVTNWPPCAITGTPTKSNGTVITWPTATTAWGTATHWAIYDATSAGNMIAHGPIGSSHAIAIGSTPKIAIGGLSFTLNNSSNGGLTDYAKRKLLDHTFGGGSGGGYVYSPVANLYTGLGTALTGDTLTEWEDSGYTRQVTAFTTATTGTCPNTDAETFNASVVDGEETLTHYGIWDDATAGNLLATGAVNSSKIVQIGDSATLAAGACVVTIQ